MPSLNQVKGRVTNWLETAVWPLILTRQETYISTHSGYWQGLRTHLVEPDHQAGGYADTEATEEAVKPHDVDQTWLDILPEISIGALPAVFKIDVYDGPSGKGFVGTVYMRYNGTLYSRSQNHGPETFRTDSWHEVNESELP